MLDLPKLRIFATVARLGSFTRAAELLYLAQPTVSQQLAALESQLGVPLIERLPRQLRLTPAGAALLPYAEQMLGLAEEAAAVTRDAAGLASRTLRLGVGHALAAYVLPDLLRRFEPQRLARISVGNTTELLELVAADTVELALVGSPARHPHVFVTPFMRDELVAIVAPDDALAARGKVELDQLRQRTLLVREPGSALHATVERLLGPAALASDHVIVMGETEAIKRSVEVGLGVALVQRIAIEREVAAGNLCALTLIGADTQRTYAYARREGHELSPAARDLVALLEEKKA